VERLRGWLEDFEKEIKDYRLKMGLFRSRLWSPFACGRFSVSTVTAREWLRGLNHVVLSVFLL
jgi:hypothetical protein